MTLQHPWLALFLAWCLVPSCWLMAPVRGQSTIADLAAADGRFTTLVELATTADLAQTPLGSSGIELTLLAPTNDAFSKLSDRQLYYLSNNNVTALTMILAYHVVEQEIFIQNISFSSDLLVETYPPFANSNVNNNNGRERDLETNTQFPTEAPQERPVAPAFKDLSEAPSTQGITENAETLAPSSTPSAIPTFIENLDTLAPSVGPTLSPIVAPTAGPSLRPTASPSSAPTSSPTHGPSPAPVSSGPTTSPTNGPEPGPLVTLRRFYYWSWSHLRLLSAVAVNSGEAYVSAVSDLDASNGVIHGLSRVLLPPGFQFPPTDVVSVITTSGLFTLLGTLELTDLVPTLREYVDVSYTIFAPTDAAFEDVNNYQEGLLTFLLRNPDTLKTVLLHHVLNGFVLSEDVEAAGTTLTPTTLQGETIDVVYQPGTGVIVNENSAIDKAVVTDADNLALNGVVHVVDTVLIPDEIVNALPIPSVVEQVVATAPRLTDALAAEELVDSLLGDGPFTIFAPSDAAFGKLTEDPTDPLKDVLLYHVVDGYVTIDLMLELAPVRIHNKNGAKLTARTSGNGDIVLDDDSGTLATIEQSIPCINGIVHIVDKVLIPPPRTCPYRSRFWCWLFGWR